MAFIVFLTFCLLAGEYFAPLHLEYELKFSLAVSALPIEEHASRIHGENGWFVPQVGDDFKWLTLEEAQGQLAAYESLNNMEIAEHFSINAVSFYLYTRRNPKEGQLITATAESIDASNFDAANPTR